MKSKKKIRLETIAAFNNCPTPHTLKNRQAGMAMVRDAAARGNVICLRLESLMGMAEASRMSVNDQVDYANDDDGWDDIRPF
jgi:hypothetical protein